MKTIAVLFGGASPEHDVSCISVQTILKNIDMNLYKIILIGITKQGEWLHVPHASAIIDGTWNNSATKAIISPDRVNHSIIMIKDDFQCNIEHVDIVFPVLHGKNGEDGTIQGLLELAAIPYVGCGILSSAVSMDKLYTKLIASSIGISQANYVSIVKSELDDMENTIKKIESTLDYPVFIKPSSTGSSVGITKAHNRRELSTGLLHACQFDRKLLVEETIIGRELECAVLGGSTVSASGVGEILAAAEFYDYDAKYNSKESQTILSPHLPDGILECIQKNATDIFKAVDGFGLARVDFFLEKDTNRIIFNEINTLPGFTSISMYPMLWKDQGMNHGELIQRLIDLAEERYTS